MGFSNLYNILHDAKSNQSLQPKDSKLGGLYDNNTTYNDSSLNGGEQLDQFMRDPNSDNYSGYTKDELSKLKIGKYRPYVYEVCSSRLLHELIIDKVAISHDVPEPFDSNMEVADEIFNRIKYLKFKYPLQWVKDKVSDKYYPYSVEQTIEVNYAIQKNSEYLCLLRNLWFDRYINYFDYLHTTYTGDSNVTSSATGTLHHEGKTHSDLETTNTTVNDNVNDGNTTTTGDSKTNNETTTKGHVANTGETVVKGSSTSDTTQTGSVDNKNSNDSTTDGTIHVEDTSTNDTKTTGTVAAITANNDYPESNNLSGMYNPGAGVQPGTVGIDYISNSSEDNHKTNMDNNTTTNNISNNANHSETKSNGTSNSATTNTTSNKSTNTSDTTNTSTSDSTGSNVLVGENTTTGTSTTHDEDKFNGSVKGSNIDDGTSTGDQNTKNDSNVGSLQSGRNKDLIELSSNFQLMIKARDKYISEVVRILKPCFANYIDGFSSNFMFGLNEDTFENDNN